VSLFLAHFVHWVSNVVFVSVEKQLAVFWSCFSIVPSALPGRGLKTFSHFKCPLGNIALCRGVGGCLTERIRNVADRCNVGSV
jgi:hypothetical protein